MSGIQPAAVTVLVQNKLRAAVNGDKLDITHPAIVDYWDLRKAPKTDDPLYPAFLALWQEMGDEASTGAIASQLQIGDKRARQLYGAMVVSGDFRPILTQRPLFGMAKVADDKKKKALKDIPEKITDLNNWTIGEILDRWGTSAAFLDWLKATKSLEEINEKRLKNAVTQGILIQRGMVRAGILDPIDSAHIKLLTDGAKTIAKRTMAMTQSGRPLEDIEKFVGDQISSFLKPMRVAIQRTLKSVEPK